MIPYGKQSISEADIEAVVEVLRSDWITQGPMVPRFEDAVASYCGASYAVAVNSATSALHIACLALGVRPGDRVWTSPNTFVASANCAIYCGAEVDFVDIDPATYNISLPELSRKLVEAASKGVLPKVVIPVHFAGQSCDMAGIQALAQEYGFRVLEDASHAIGGKYKSEPIGNCRYSDITVFSFHPVKVVTCGEGGMTLSNDASLVEAMRCHRNHGIAIKTAHMLPRPSDEIWRYQQVNLGYNYRMTDIQAALGVSQMKRLDEFVVKRHRIAQKYDAAFKSLSVTVPWQHPDAWSSYHLYPICVQKANCGKTQAQVSDALISASINVNLHYIPVYRQPYYEAMGFKAGYCPQAERYFRETITLPMFPALSQVDQESVIGAVNNLVR
jgi:UDP-4-amino-4,6-dideoxy-N-acetyl-beta-L-altrosamine transaminase